MKYFIILIAIIIVLITLLIIITMNLRKTKKALEEATIAFNKAKIQLDSCVKNLALDIDKQLNGLQGEITKLLKDAKERYNNNSNTIGDKLTANGFEVEK